MGKKNLHFVFQAYLKKWSTKYSKIINNHEEDHFYKLYRVYKANEKYQYDNPDVRDIASELYFCRLQLLNECERNFIRQNINKNDWDLNNETFVAIRNMLEKYELIKTLSLVSFDNQTYKSIFDEKMEIIESCITDLSEEYFIETEERLSKLIGRVEVDESYVIDKDNVGIYTKDILTQYFRTRKSKKLLEQGLRKIGINEKMRIDAIFPYLVAIYSLNTTKGLLANGINNITILVNDSNKKFITSDSPVVFVKEDQSYIYYPIGPKYALLINKSTEKWKHISNADIYNLLVINEFDEELYMFNEEEAKNYCKLLNEKKLCQR